MLEQSAQRLGTLELPIAASSLLVALSLTFPLSWLYERAGNSLWPGAILHCTIQGAIKLVVTRDEDFLGLALTWMAISALAPWLVFTRLLEPACALPAH